MINVDILYHILHNMPYVIKYVCEECTQLRASRAFVPYMPRVPSCPTCLTCLRVSRAYLLMWLLAHVPYVSACLRAFAS